MDEPDAANFDGQAPHQGVGGALPRDRTEEDLDAYLTDPDSFLPGTSKTLIGIGDSGERAELIAYLKTLRFATVTRFLDPDQSRLDGESALAQFSPNISWKRERSGAPRANGAATAQVPRCCVDRFASRPFRLRGEC